MPEDIGQGFLENAEEGGGLLPAHLSIVYKGIELAGDSCAGCKRRCQLNRTSAIATSTSERLTDCFLQAAKARLVISCQFWNLLCIS